MVEDDEDKRFHIGSFFLALFKKFVNKFCRCCSCSNVCESSQNYLDLSDEISKHLDIDFVLAYIRHLDKKIEIVV